ncbi:MAG: hypothetical protein F6J93_22805 [Oscillatoria sp. SIO1A7]|nr:hypothetical protein [Oscillatoria sp. SIO1A7]
MDSHQIFQLIDSILPFEACLYHEVLPLSIQGSRLHLGMVDPSDAAALDYVRRILGYVNCSLVPERLEPEKHKSILSAYLSQSRSKSSGSPTKPVAKANSISTTASKTASGKSKDSTQKKASPGSQVASQGAKTAFVFQPRGELVGKERQPVPPSYPSIAPEPEADNVFQPRGELVGKELQPVPPSYPEKPSIPPEPEADKPQVLEVKASLLDAPVEKLASLPPDRLLQELLARVLQGGIGRLYFEQQADCGRILWSQNGIVQSILEKLPLPLFLGVIRELKKLTHLPLEPIKQPKQVELSGRYQQADLLLRLRVMSGNHGEEATLQVLRGAALKFYQQQQIAALSREALRLAQELHSKVNQLESSARDNRSLHSKHLDDLPNLSQIVGQVHKQIEAIAEAQTNRE